MGLIKAGVGATSAVLADSWRDYFICEALDADVLAAKGVKHMSSKGRSSNTKGEDNIITNGSVIAVNEGQCMLIVEQGTIVEVCAKPGEFVYDKGKEPSILSSDDVIGDLGDSVKRTFAEIGKRFTFGGDTGIDQRIYFVNTKEIVGNKYGTTSPIPFRVVDANIGLDIDISIRCNGLYSYKIVDPLLFYKNVCGNIESIYTRDKIDAQLKSELLTALQPAFAKISATGIRYSAVPAHTSELAHALNEELSAQWRDLRGMEVTSLGVNSITASEQDEQMIKDLQKAATMRETNMRDAAMTSATADAMRTAAGNEGGMGAMGGFIGMNMAAGMSTACREGLSTSSGTPLQSNHYDMAADGGFSVHSDNADKATWTCECGTQNTGKFCSNCGKPKPEPAAAWTCGCGAQNTGKFCSNCGKPKPQ